MIQLSKDELQGMLDRAAEAGAEKALQHFGVYDEKSKHKLSLQWDRMTKFMDLYDGAALTVGKGFLALVGAATAIILGSAAAIRLGLFDGKN